MISSEDRKFVFPPAMPDLNSPEYKAILLKISQPPSWPISQLVIAVFFLILGCYGLIQLRQHINSQLSVFSVILFPVGLISTLAPLLLHCNAAAKLALYRKIAEQPQEFTIDVATLKSKGWIVNSTVAGADGAGSYQSIKYLYNGKKYKSPYMHWSVTYDICPGQSIYVAIDSQNRYDPIFLGVAGSGQLENTHIEKRIEQIRSRAPK